MGIATFFLLVLWITTKLENVSCATFEKTFCVDFNVGSSPYFNIKVANPPPAPPDVFPTKFLEAVKQPCLAYLHPTTAEPSTPPFIYRSASVVRVHSTGKTLKHWVFYEMEFKLAPHDVEVRGIINQADSDGAAGFGQFVPCNNRPGLCPLQDPLQFIPCKYYYSVEPLPPTVYVWTDQAPVYQPPPGSPPTGKVQLLWRFNNNICNHPKKITFRGAVILQAKRAENPPPPLPPSSQPPFNAYLIPPIVIELTDLFSSAGSSSDVLPEPEFRITPTSMTILPEPWNWIKRTEFVKVESKDVEKYVLDECQASNISTPTKSYNCKDGMPSCRPFNPVYRNVKKQNALYPEYRNYVDARLDFYCLCGKPQLGEREPDVISLNHPIKLNPLRPLKGVPTRRKPKPRPPALREGWNFTHGLGLTTFPGKDVWNFRMIHGLAEVVATMFITPVSMFMARHYKETFMKQRILFNKPWFMIHLLSVFVNLQLHVYGLFAMYLGRSLFGVSIRNNNRDMLDAARQGGELHAVLGIFPIAIFGFLTVFGGIRSISESWRMCYINLHWLLGLTCYLWSLAMIITSSYIPGSPSDMSLKYETDSDNARISSRPQPRNPVLQHIIPIIVICWLLIDIAFNIAMDILRGCYNKALHIIRPFSFVPIPVLKDSNQSDVAGSFVRKLLLLCYVLLALCCCGVVCALIAFRPVESAGGFGPMTCTHTPDGKAFDINALESCKITLLFDPDVITRRIPKIPHSSIFVKV